MSCFLLLLLLQYHFLDKPLERVKRQPDPKGFSGPLVEKLIEIGASQVKNKIKDEKNYKYDCE
jgi:hypothetical protein